MKWKNTLPRLFLLSLAQQALTALLYNKQNIRNSRIVLQ